MERSPKFLHCSLCGMEFAKADTICSHGCPLGASCNHVRCPSCGYEFPETRPAPSWLARLLQRRRKTPHTNGTTLPLERLRAGERGRLVRLSCSDAHRRNTLTVFGLVPGTEVTLIQRRPSYVVRVGETELGLDQEIAKEILVKLI